MPWICRRCGDQCTKVYVRQCLHGSENAIYHNDDEDLEDTTEYVNNEDTDCVDTEGPYCYDCLGTGQYDTAVDWQGVPEEESGEQLKLLKEDPDLIKFE